MPCKKVYTERSDKCTCFNSLTVLPNIDCISFGI